MKNKMLYNLLKKCVIISVFVLFVFSNISTASNNSLYRLTNKKSDEIIQNNEKSDFPATGFFYVAEKDGVWWFVNSTGEKFFIVGDAISGPNDFYYGNISDWFEITRDRLKEWGFNTVNNPNVPDMPFVDRFGTKSLVRKDSWVLNPRFPDVFDPDWRENVSKSIDEHVELYKNNSNLIGYESDNEMKWGPDYIVTRGDNLTLLEMYMSATAEAPGKKELVRFLSERYDNDTDEFNRVWNMNIQNFTDLFNYTRFGIEGWRVQSQLRIAKIKLYRDNPRFLREPQLLKKAEKDVTDFSRYLAKTYFSFINTTLKTADPNHLYLGVRFHLLGVPREVLEECGKYVDVISINYYRTNTRIYDPLNFLLSKRYDCVTLDHWMRKYHEISGKPLMIEECISSSNDGSWPKITGIELHKTRTEKQRADFYNWYALNCQKNPYMVGQGFYFEYADRISGDGGLVNLWDEPYADFVNQITDINLKAIENHENAIYSKSYINKPSDISFLSDRLPLSLDSYKKILGSSFTLETLPSYSDEECSMYRPETDRSYSYNFNIANSVDDVKTHYVGGIGTNNYTKIQDAVDNSSNGDTIFVYNGTYHEKLIINKSISLFGEDRTGTNISGVYEEPDNKYQDRVITIEADYVNITGFNITTEGGFIGCTKTYKYCTGLYLKKHNNTNISGNIFYKLKGYGMISLKSDYTKITNNVFYNYGVKDGCGIIVDSSNNTLIDNNTFEDNELYGIWLSCCKNNKIQNNFVSKSKFGITIWKAHDNIVLGNTLKENKEKGICLKECINNTIISNNFIGNPTSASFFYSYDNNWNGNYWGRPRFLPKLIFGKTGKDGLIPVVDIDYHPLKKLYEP